MGTFVYSTQLEESTCDHRLWISASEESTRDFQGAAGIPTLPQAMAARVSQGREQGAPPPLTPSQWNIKSEQRTWARNDPGATCLLWIAILDPQLYSRISWLGHSRGHFEDHPSCSSHPESRNSLDGAEFVPFSRRTHPETFVFLVATSPLPQRVFQKGIYQHGKSKSIVRNLK